MDAKVCVKDLDLFVTVQLLDGTPVVLSSGKSCEEHGVFQVKHQISRKNRRIIIVNPTLSGLGVVFVLSSEASSSGSANVSVDSPNQMIRR